MTVKVDVVVTRVTLVIGGREVTANEVVIGRTVVLEDGFPIVS